MTRTGTTIPTGPITAAESPDYNKAKQRPVCQNAHWMISQSEFLQSRRELIIAAVFLALCPLSPPLTCCIYAERKKKNGCRPTLEGCCRAQPSCWVLRCTYVIHMVVYSDFLQSASPSPLGKLHLLRERAIKKTYEQMQLRPKSASNSSRSVVFCICRKKECMPLTYGT